MSATPAAHGLISRFHSFGCGSPSAAQFAAPTAMPPVDDDDDAPLRLDRVAGLEVVLHRRAALQSQALLEPALACGINGAIAAKPPALDLGQNSAVLANSFTRGKPRRRSRSLMQEPADNRAETAPKSLISI